MLLSKTNSESDVRKLKGLSRQEVLTNAQDALGTWQVVQGLGENSLSERWQSWLGQHFHSYWCKNALLPQGMRILLLQMKKQKEKQPRAEVLCCAAQGGPAGTTWTSVEGGERVQPFLPKNSLEILSFSLRWATLSFQKWFTILWISTLSQKLGHWRL